MLIIKRGAHIVGWPSEFETEGINCKIPKERK